MRIIKFWAKTRKINSRMEGTLSTYTLVMQAFYVLHMKHVLPRLHEVARAPGGPRGRGGEARAVAGAQAGGADLLFPAKLEGRAFKPIELARGALRGRLTKSEREQADSLRCGDLVRDFFLFFGTDAGGVWCY